ncbi:hypothetical protein M8818_004487 [Zalaria obscura]|uniref:Uncharacterized protein n=1 Tax=Zalaria obscura TaxID=2024903 RepID=A0ACC3SBZ2_9PEZI
MPTAAPAPTQATKGSQRSADEALIAGGVVGTASGVAFIQSALLYAKSNGILSDAHASEEDDLVVGVSTGNDDFFNRLARPAPLSFCPDKRMMAHFWRPFHKTQDQYNLLSREEFNRHLDLFYRAKPQQENHSRIIVHTVFATGVHELSKIGDHSSVHLAAAHYETALGLIQHVLPCKDVRTLQAILVVLHLSVLDPQRNLAGHLLGCALRVATSLGLHQEEISTSAEKVFPDFGRRMFWCLHRIDLAVADMLADPALLEDQDDASLTSHSTDKLLFAPARATWTSGRSGIDRGDGAIRDGKSAIGVVAALERRWTRARGSRGE